MKPTLDAMTDMVVTSLSGEARIFYDREFGFFDEVTSISGKLKPFIKKTKPEKKVNPCPVYFTLVELGCRQKSTKKWRRLRSKWVYIYPAILTGKLWTSTKNPGGLCRVMPRYAVLSSTSSLF